MQAFQLQKWYRTLDALLPLKAALEEHLFGRFRHLFAPHCELVFYDLTSTYFEGLGPEELAQHGYSRDQRPRNPQLLVGVAMVDGLPVSHTVFAGNRRDSTTVREVLADLRKRFGLGRFVFVGDRGMKSEASVAALEEQGLGYLMAVQGRRNPEMAAALQAVREEAWAPCEGADGRVKANGSRVQEVTEEGSRRRRFLVHAPERERHERKLREAEQDKVRERLERLRERVALGEFGKRAQREVQAEREPPEGERSEVEAEAVREKAAGLIGEAAGKILSQNHGQRYYDWRLAGEERLEYWENESCVQEKRREGHWLLETEETALGAVEAVRAYQELWRVEAGLPQHEGRAGATPDLASHGRAGAGARAGGGLGADVRPDPAAQAGEGGVAVEFPGGVGGAGGGEPGGVRDAGAATEGGDLCQRRGGRSRQRGAQGAAGAGRRPGGSAAPPKRGPNRPLKRLQT